MSGRFKTWASFKVKMQNFSISAIPLIVVVLIHLLWRNLSFEWFIGALVAKIIIFFVLTVHRHRNGDVSRLAEKDKQNYESRVKNYKQTFHSVVHAAKQTSYMITDVVPAEKNGVFLVSFSGKVSTLAMPEIILDNKKVTVERYSDKEGKIICHCAEAISANTNRLNFKSGSYFFGIENPYYLPDGISTKNIKWQRKGHSDERNIFIEAKCFPFIDNLINYEFILLINNVRFEKSLIGKYSSVDNAIKINLPKVDLENKECQLITQFGERQKIKLPEPVTFFKNHIRVVNF